jgi:hypothetical protein
MSGLAEISGQPYKVADRPKAPIWRGAQRCSIILQPGFLPLGKVRQGRNTALTSIGQRPELI